MGTQGEQPPAGSQLKATIFIVYVQLLCVHIYERRTSLVNAPMYFFSSSTTLQTHVYTLSSMKDKLR